MACRGRSAIHLLLRGRVQPRLRALDGAQGKRRVHARHVLVLPVADAFR